MDSSNQEREAGAEHAGHLEDEILNRRQFGEQAVSAMVTAQGALLAGCIREDQDGPEMAADTEHTTPEQKAQLFADQKEGYAKLLALAEDHGEGTEVFSAHPPIVLIPYDRVTALCGKEAAEKARAGGKKILGCSDGRVVFTGETIHRAKEAHTIPENVPDEAMKAGYPGLGALLTSDDRRLFYGNVRKRDDVVVEAFHEDCGACDGDRALAQRLAEDLDKNALHAPIAACGYSENCTFRMTGFEKFHQELGMVVSASDRFAAERLPIASHMQLAAYLEPSDTTLNMHVEKLYSILMDHGWDPEQLREHPIVITVVGDTRDKNASAQQMVARLQPTWRKLEKQFPGTFKIVAFDA